MQKLLVVVLFLKAELVGLVIVDEIFVFWPNTSWYDEKLEHIYNELLASIAQDRVTDNRIWDLSSSNTTFIAWWTINCQQSTLCQGSFVAVCDMWLLGLSLIS